MKRNELTKTFMMISSLKKPFGFHCFEVFSLLLMFKLVLENLHVALEFCDW